MIYPFIRVPLPDISGYVEERGKVRYFYAYVGPRLRTKSGRSTHPSARMLGRVETSASGRDELMPNTFYYEFMKLPLPSEAVAEGAGRKPAAKAKAAPDKEEGSGMSMGYGLAATALAEETGLLGALQEALGTRDACTLLGLAAFLADGAHSSLSKLNSFIDCNFPFLVDPSFDRRMAGELLVRLAPQARSAFYKAWNTAQGPASREIFYDVTSFSTYSGQIRRASYGYNRDGEDLPQINEGLFCCRETGMPLFMCSYNGSLNDASNFSHALELARACQLKPARRGLVMIMDGGFSSDSFSWLHLDGWKFIGGVSPARIKAVREAFLKWAHEVNDDVEGRMWEVNGHPYVSGRVPFTLGGVDGVLVMCRDIESRSAMMRSLMARKMAKKAELDGCRRCPGSGFDAWAASFKPFFIVEKAGNSRGFKYSEDAEDFKERGALAGKAVLFTTCAEMSDQEIMEAYRSKESVEDCFDTTKNGLCDGRLHIQGDAQADGKLFAMFVSLILRRTIHSRVRSWLKANNATDEDVIEELKQIKYVKIGGKWKMKDALAKRQRELLQELKLDLSFMDGTDGQGAERTTH